MNMNTKTALRNSLITSILILGIQISLLAQVVIFSENMGVPSATTLVTSYTGWQNSGVLTFSNGGQAGTADVRTTNASTNYPNSSGGGNIFFTGTSATIAGGFSIEGINASAFRNLQLNYAYRKESATAFPNFAVEFWDGSNWVTIANTAASLFLESADAVVGWYSARPLNLPAAAQINGLRIRFVRLIGGTVTIRVDDVSLSGTPAVVGTCGTNAVVTSSVTSSCGPANINLNVQSGPLVTGASWVWYSGSCGGTRLGTGPSLTGIPVNTTSTFFVRTEGGTCGNTRPCESVTVTVTPIPTLSVEVLGDTSLMPGKTTTLIGTANPASTGLVYTWRKNGVPVVGASQSSLVVGIDDLGTYSFSVQTLQGCTATSPGRVINAAASEQAWIHPNPTVGPFKVRYFSRATVFNFNRVLYVYDAAGRIVFTQTYPITGPYSSMDVDLSHLNKGLYQVLIRKSNGEKINVGQVVLQ